MMDKFITRGFQRRMYIKTGAKKCESDNNKMSVQFAGLNWVSGKYKQRAYCVKKMCGNQGLETAKNKVIEIKLMEWGFTQ